MTTRSARNLVVFAAALSGCRVDGWRPDRGPETVCPVKAGEYADGIHVPASAAFARAFSRHSPWIGCPAANGDLGMYAHHQAGLDLQDFYQPDQSARITPDGRTVLIYNPDGNEAFLLQGQFWHAYACLGQRDTPSANLGGGTLLGAPTNEQYYDDQGLRQDFLEGRMRRGPKGNLVMLFLKEMPSQANDLATECRSQGLEVEMHDLREADAGGSADAGGADGGSRQNACTRNVDFTRAVPAQGGGAETPSCTLDEWGAVVLEYADTRCPVGQDSPFRGCEFAWHQNLEAFDPLRGNGGVFEVFFCISGPVNGAVNVWYQEGDCKECRYSLPLLSGDESLQGCRKVYIAAADVGRNVPWAPGPFCHASDPSSGRCSSQVDSGVLDASVTATPTGEFGATMDGGQGRPNFGDSRLVLMTEWCDAGKSAAADAGPARITLRSVTYHPEECLCSTDQDCGGGQYCQQVSWPDRACCACSGCRNICR